jgi:hypothetical protein
MTQWRTPGESPGPPEAPEEAADRRADRTRPQLRGQWLVLGIAGAFIVAAVVLLIVVLAGGGGSGGAARPGAADVVTDKLAAAVQSGSVAQVRTVSCSGAQGRVVNAVRPVFGSSTSRQGTADVQGDVAVGQVALTGTSAARSATIGLRRVGAQWCVASVVAGG